MDKPSKPSWIVINRDRDDIVSILNTKNGQVFVTNATGEYILSLCDGQHSQGGIVSAICAKIDSLNSQEVVQDVSDFLTVALEKGVVV
ncbi:MAG: PqqD family protein [Firmicutes bacterium]|nr:PqqD family protein [Bacillota bacterium]